jgi:seryl-tRNA synthetase
MIDITLIREKPEWVKEQYKRRYDEAAVARIDSILSLDQQRRALLTETETLQAERKKLNTAMGRFRGNKNMAPEAQAVIAVQAADSIAAGDYGRALGLLNDPPPAATGGAADRGPALARLTDVLRGMGERVEALGKQIEGVETALRDNMLWLPNMSPASVPVGASGDENVAHPHEGELPHFDFAPKPHWEIGPALDIIDFERGVKLSGTRFYVLKGMGARLQRALINFFLDRHTAAGFKELYLPFIIKEDMMYGAGQFPKFRGEVFQDTDAGLYMLPTAEVAIANLHRDEILEAEQLPLYYVANTPCWRREATSAGRDVRGIKRVHQFQKVEMFKITTPETSYAELESLVESASALCRALQIPFRRVELVTGDIGFAMACTYDLEMWAPGCNEWLEVSSCSNAEAFQARRAQVRYRPAAGAKSEYVHTLNGSGLAAPRVIIAILENYQQADGSVVVPDVLRPYMGGLEVIEPR